MKRDSDHQGMKLRDVPQLNQTGVVGIDYNVSCYYGWYPSSTQAVGAESQGAAPTFTSALAQATRFQEPAEIRAQTGEVAPANS